MINVFYYMKMCWEGGIYFGKKSECAYYGITGYGVSRPGIQN
jgi:hypothetical protein